MEINYEYVSQLINEERWNECYGIITEGLKSNYTDYELYFALGEYYLRKNAEQAYLCYENALFFCKDVNDKEYIANVMEDVKEQYNVKVRPYSIVIVSYNSSDVMKLCINSIRRNNDIICNEIIVVDNNSSDGICEWLRTQNDIYLIENKENKGFGGGLNQGIKAALPENDIFLLNNDTIVVPNAIFWLRMGLYESDRIGAVSCESNYAAGQWTKETYDNANDYIQYGIRNNIPDVNPYEKRVWLSGFALMFRRRALDEVGLLDKRYGMGYYEDNDICVRLQYAGYQCILCHNSFIFHWGSQSFGKVSDKQNELMNINRQIFRDKWKFDIVYYSYARSELISLIEADKNDNIRVLEVGCGCGATLAKIKYMWPLADVKGIELVDRIAQIGANNMDIIQGNIESMSLDYENAYFDYVIFADVLEHLCAPDKTLVKLKRYMKIGAKLIISIPNIMHYSVLIPLLKGEFTYKDSGILDKTHMRLFTLKSIINLLSECGYIPEKYFAIKNDGESADISEQEKTSFFEIIKGIEEVADDTQFDAYQYVLVAKV